MPKDDRVYLGHMKDAAAKAVGKVKGLSREAFDADENLRLALAHLIPIVGEAARRVSDGTRSLHSEIPWSEIIGMRHKVVHDCFGVDWDLVWDVVSHDLPPLVAALAPLVFSKNG
ncbi:MAG: DUF86 domain-containing protein [Candidatus Riflebacteria bacterium]|nr:DUF86 domain-containing protein [Candidatus Riflebacteria bacterium]